MFEAAGEGLGSVHGDLSRLSSSCGLGQGSDVDETPQARKLIDFASDDARDGGYCVRPAIAVALLIVAVDNDDAREDDDSQPSLIRFLLLRGVRTRPMFDSEGWLIEDARLDRTLNVRDLGVRCVGFLSCKTASSSSLDSRMVRNDDDDDGTLLVVSSLEMLC